MLAQKMWAVQRFMNEFVATGLYPLSFSDTADVVIPSLKFTYPGVLDTGEFDREMLPYTVMSVVQVGGWVCAACGLEASHSSHIQAHQPRRRPQSLQYVEILCSKEAPAAAAEGKSKGKSKGSSAARQLAEMCGLAGRTIARGMQVRPYLAPILALI